MRILLIHPPVKGGSTESPLGVGYIGSVLKENNYEVRIIDMASSSFSTSDLYSALLKYHPQIVGVSFMTPQFSFAGATINIVKEACPDCKIVVGGAHASAMLEDCFRISGIDLVAMGEGEETMLELVRELDGGAENFEKVKSLAYKMPEGTIRINERRPLIGSISKLPFPLWEELSKYSHEYIPVYGGRKRPVFPIITARGCPFNCNFCDEGNIWGRKVRFRDIEDVADEIEWLYRDFNARTFNILDDTFTLRTNRVHALCDMILQRNLKIDWRCTGKVTTINEEMLRHMKSAGCKSIAYGVESGDQGILNNVRKRQTLEDAKRAFKITRCSGLKSFALCMVGNLGETKESMGKTISFVKELNTDYASCAIMTPYPGSEMYRICEENGWIRHRDWDKWVPTPHSISHYSPPAIVGTLTEKELMNAYYTFDRRWVINTWKQIYGKLFFFNIHFIRNEIINRIQKGDLTQLVKTAWRSIFSNS